jgi:YfiH family protein
MSDTLADRLKARRLDWIVPAWQGPARVRAFFTTRNGGASSGANATLDLGTASPSAADLAGAIGENRRRIRAALPSDPVWLAQVHGRDVVAVAADTVAALRAVPPHADAAVTRVPGIVLAVRTADCLPVLFAARDGSVVAVAHAGWRGLAAGVLEAAITAMDVPACGIAVWIGPAIGPSAFEVGQDVHAAHCASDPGASAHFVATRDGKWLADLPALARRRLAAIGVTDVLVDGACTFADAQRFHSWRRDRSSARMALLAWLAPG